MVQLFPRFHRCNNSLMNKNIPVNIGQERPSNPSIERATVRKGFVINLTQCAGCWQTVSPPVSLGNVHFRSAPDHNTSATLTCLEFTSHWPSSRRSSLLRLIHCWVQTSSNCFCTCTFFHVEALMSTFAAFKLLNLRWPPQCRSWQRFYRRTRI